MKTLWISLFILGILPSTGHGAPVGENFEQVDWVPGDVKPGKPKPRPTPTWEDLELNKEELNCDDEKDREACLQRVRDWTPDQFLPPGVPRPKPKPHPPVYENKPDEQET